jgi:hypothetical protein
MISRNYEKGLFYYDFLYANLVFHWHFHIYIYIYNNVSGYFFFTFKSGF